jgi:hypothetical protein
MFKNEIKKFSKSKIHKQAKERGITLRVFDKDLVTKLFEISTSYRTRPCNHHPVCPALKGKKHKPCKKCKPIKIKELLWPEIKLTKKFFRSKKSKIEFLKTYISCDGYATIFPRTNSWSKVERIIAIICYHPMLKKEISKFLKDLKIQHSIKEEGLFIRKETSIRRFSTLVGFLKGVKVSKNSKYWKIEKSEILRKIIRSYHKKFSGTNKEEIIKEIKNL